MPVIVLLLMVIAEKMYWLESMQQESRPELIQALITSSI